MSNFILKLSDASAAVDAAQKAYNEALKNNVNQKGLDQLFNVLSQSVDELSELCKEIPPE
jgi:hypothetical protein